MFSDARSKPPLPGGPNKKLRTSSTSFVLISCALCAARPRKIESIPSSTGTLDALKNASLSGTSIISPEFFTLSRSGESWLCPYRYDAVENSFAMPGFTLES